MNAPPDYVIEAARLAALESPCAKSKRGVVLFNREDHDRFEKNYPGRGNHQLAIASRGFNGPPTGFSCTQDYSCRGNCAKLCMHAEARAIYAAGALDDVCDLELVHVKVVDGAVVPAGGPSCWQCSRLVVEVGLRGVWLFEAQRWHDEVPCDKCCKTTVVAQSDGTTGVCSFCDRGMLDLGRTKRIYASDSGEWRLYAARAFHEATLAECGIGSR